ncbi:hypothetical protein [Gluconacetobacter tumulisoli]|uniref:hypothetical protein n=1 Tax=Gluconacetobacter tumulisoli TaxID=1286189 RepID=UPI001600AE5C|nr:hypothetical protein [Gluconacetobacter tumulisoli]
MRHASETAASHHGDDEKRRPAPGVSSPPEARPDPDADVPPSPEEEPQDLPEPLTLPQHDGPSDKTASDRTSRRHMADIEK